MIHLRSQLPLLVIGSFLPGMYILATASQLPCSASRYLCSGPGTPYFSIISLKSGSFWPPDRAWPAVRTRTPSSATAHTNRILIVFILDGTNGIVAGRNTLPDP